MYAKFAESILYGIVLSVYFKIWMDTLLQSSKPQFIDTELINMTVFDTLQFPSKSSNHELSCTVYAIIFAYSYFRGFGQVR